MAISIRDITPDNWRQCIDLQVAEAQEHFVAPNVRSLAEAYVHKDCYPRAIYKGDEMIGFVMYGRDSKDGKDWIIRFMIDHQHQGKGYGRAALQAVIDLLRQQPNCTAIRLSYEPENSVAEKLYESFGFRKTGEMDGNEIISELVVQDRSEPVHLKA